MSFQDLPRPALVVTVKPAAAGGSTLVARLVQAGVLEAADVLSADALRLEYLGDEASQARAEDIFRELYLRTRTRLAARHSVWVDITGLDARTRKQLAGFAEAAGVPAFAALRAADLSFEELCRRNRSRTRQVPDEDVEGEPRRNVLRLQHQRHAQITPAQLEAEGFEVLIWDDTTSDALLPEPTLQH